MLSAQKKKQLSKRIKIRTELKIRLSLALLGRCRFICNFLRYSITRTYENYCTTSTLKGISSPLQFSAITPSLHPLSFSNTTWTRKLPLTPPPSVIHSPFVTKSSNNWKARRYSELPSEKCIITKSPTPQNRSQKKHLKSEEWTMILRRSRNFQRCRIRIPAKTNKTFRNWRNVNLNNPPPTPGFGKESIRVRGLKPNFISCIIARCLRKKARLLVRT